MQLGNEFNASIHLALRARLLLIMGISTTVEDAFNQNDQPYPAHKS